MTERPILFSGPMIRAILDGTKTQTRRIVKPQPSRDLLPGEWIPPKCPYGIVGDRLWTRETWCRYGSAYLYRADQEQFTPISDRIGGSWKPSIHMPRGASRITLDIVGIRIERLGEISEADALSEGVGVDGQLSPVERFANLWVKINGAGSFDANPFVCVIEFRRLEK